MGSESCFFVYFAGSASLDDAEAALRKTTLSVVRDGGALVVRWEEGPELLIGLSDEPHVRLEAEDWAERRGVPELARCDRRFEVGFDDLEAVLFETNTLAEVQMTLQDLTKGYITMAWNHEVMRPTVD
jgi:hypothetical protein